MLGNGRADDRRRRVLTEELIGGKASAEAADVEAAARLVSGSPSRNRYGDSARMKRQPRIVDLLPRSYGVLAALAFAGIALVAALEAGHYYLPQLVRFSASGRIPALELAGEQSLATWLTTTFFSFSAAAAAVIYSVRKHRADDYHGRYRIWLAAAVACFYLGVDVSANLHETIRDLAIGLSRQHGFGAGSIWWIGLYTLALGAVAVRLLLDLRECRTSTTLFSFTLLTAAAGLLLVLNGELHWLAPPPGIDMLMIEQGLVMSAGLLLLGSLLVHGRYVVLEAEGEITPRPAKAKKEKPAKAERATKVAKAAVKDEDDDEPQEKRSLFGFFKRTKIDPPHTAVAAPARKTTDLQTAAKSSNHVPSSAFEEVERETERRTAKVNKVRADFSDLDDEDDDDHDHRKLSKAQRKALRRNKEMERRGYED